VLRGIIISRFRKSYLKNIFTENKHIVIDGEFEKFTYEEFDYIDFFIIDPLVDTKQYWTYMEWIRKRYPKAMIIVISTNSNFVLKSFEYNLIDYITKPNDLDRIYRSIEKLLLYNNIKEDCLHDIEIRTFKSFELYVDSEYINMGYNKARELFAFLIHNRGNSVGWEKIVENLWPEFDYEKGHSSLHSTSHRLRKKLIEYGIEDIYEVNRDSYRINIELCSIDNIEFEKRLCDDNSFEAYKLYRGNYFENERYDWTIFQREEYKKTYNHLCESLIYG
jgi:two-component SAPR family response regulator